MPKIKINDKQIHYLDEGEGHPILMGHSYLWNSEMWRPQIEQLKHKYRCIVPDLWGHGQSDNTHSEHCSIEQLADDMWTFSQALGLKTFSLLGLSVGGMWSAHLAVKHPEQITSMVMMDTYLGQEEPEKQALYLGMLSAVEQAQCVPEVLHEKILPMFLTIKTLQEPENPFKQQLMNNLKSVNEDNVSTMVALGREIFTRNSLLDKFHLIQCPVLIMAGEQDMPRPPEEAQEMHKLIPGSEYFTVPEAGHIANLENPDFVNSKLDDFFARNI